MSKKRKAIIIRHGRTENAFDITEGQPILMDEKYLQGIEPNFTKYTVEEKWMVYNSTLDNMKVWGIDIPINPPNVACSPPYYGDASFQNEGSSNGTCGLLAITEIWENAFAGFWLVGSLLIAMRCTALRKAIPDIPSFVTEVKDASHELIELMSFLIHMATIEYDCKGIISANRLNGKHNKVKEVPIIVHRNPILGFRSGVSQFPKSIENFAFSEVYPKNCKPIRQPAVYNDTTSIIIGANNRQMREAVPLMADSYVFLIGCPKPDGLNPAVLKGADMNRISKTKIEAVRNAAWDIVNLLRWWRNMNPYESAGWASQIIARAKSHLDQPTGEYVELSPNPDKLRYAIHYEVILCFVEDAVRYGWLSQEEGERYREKARNAFYPNPIVPEVRKRIEDPEVFLALMRSIVSENKDNGNIVPEGERFVKSEKRLGAIRKISDDVYLVMPEDKWADAYRKAARSERLEISICQDEKWKLNLQHILADAGMIKHTGSNPRYRYDLYGTGKKDDTYVVAVPWNDIKPQA